MDSRGDCAVSDSGGVGGVTSDAVTFDGVGPDVG